jgi:hypothetical protein
MKKFSKTYARFISMRNRCTKKIRNRSVRDLIPCSGKIFIFIATFFLGSVQPMGIKTFICIITLVVNSRL